MAPAKIVVVDDDVDTLKMMDVLLAYEGYQTILCSKAEEAYEIIRRTNPDLVILDLMLGDPEAGWTILTLMRGDPATTDIPAIMYSANASFLRVRAGVLRMKRCAILEKPFDMDTLLVRVAEAVGPQPVK